MAKGGGSNQTLYYVYYVPGGCSEYEFGQQVWLDRGDPPPATTTLGGSGPCAGVGLQLEEPT